MPMGGEKEEENLELSKRANPRLCPGGRGNFNVRSRSWWGNSAWGTQGRVTKLLEQQDSPPS